MKKTTLIITLVAGALYLVHGAHLPDDSPASMSLHEQENKKDLLTIAVSQAKSGNHEKAVELLKQIDNDLLTVMHPFMSQLYSGNVTDLNQAAKVLALSSVSCDATLEGLHALYKKIENLGLLSDPQILVVASFWEPPSDKFSDFYSLENATDENPDCTNSTTKYNATLAPLLEPHVEKILNEWSTLIQSGNYEEIVEFINSCHDQAYNADIDFYLDKLIRKIFSSASRADAFNQTMSFANKLPYLESMSIVYLSIMEELKGLDKTDMTELMTVSFRIHEKMAIAEENYKNTTHLMEIYEIVKNRVPIEFQNLYWKPTCTIKNLEFNEYLYAEGGLASNESSNDAVFTSNKEDNLISGGHWVIRPNLSEEEEELYFLVENKYLKDNGIDAYQLCESKNTTRPILSSIHGDSYGRWFMKPELRNGTDTVGFLIKNSGYQVDYEDYFQATTEIQDESGLKRRQVVDSEFRNTSYWKIECF